MRTHWPTALPAPAEQLATTGWPSTHTGARASRSPGGKNRPSPSVQCWIAGHRLARAEQRDVALARAPRHGAGADDERRDLPHARELRVSAIVSSQRELARGLADQQTLDAAAAGVSALPGSTIRRRVPSDCNCPVT